MSIQQRVTDDMKAAMRARDKQRLTAIRGIRAALLEAMKADGSDAIEDAHAVRLLRSLAKRRIESIAAYREGGREDLGEVEQFELDVIEAYLPQLADEATTKGWIAEAVAASGATGMRDMGKVMGELKKSHADELDMRIASKLVKEALAAL